MNNRLVFMYILYTTNQSLTLEIKLITMKIVNTVTYFLNLVWKFSFEFIDIDILIHLKRHKLTEINYMSRIFIILK